MSRVEMSKKENLLPRNVGIQLPGHAAAYFRRKKASATPLQSSKKYIYWDTEFNIQEDISILLSTM
jgi:hypothetical protein